MYVSLSSPSTLYIYIDIEQPNSFPQGNQAFVFRPDETLYSGFLVPGRKVKKEEGERIIMFDMGRLEV